MARSVLIRWIWIPPFLMTCFALSLCSPPIEEAPPSAKKAITPSAAAVADLFEQECVRQRNAAWIRKQNKQRMDQCTWLDDGDCRQREDGMVAWLVPTTDHSDILVSVSWAQPGRVEGPPPGLLSCSVRVPAKMGDGLAAALSRIHYHGRPIGKPFEDEGFRDRFDTSLFWGPKLNDAASAVIWLHRYRDRNDLLDRAKDPNNSIWDDWRNNQDHYRSIKMSKQNYLQLAINPPFDQYDRNFIIEFMIY